MKNVKHYLYVPFCGLGNFGGWRGERWFRNRMKIFKQFVVPSLLNQTNKNFTVWISFTQGQKNHILVDALDIYLTEVGLPHVFTYHGICFYDDKHPKEDARRILVENLHGTMGELLDDMGDVDEVLMTIQPSDDCFYSGAVEEIQRELNSDLEAVGYKHGYIINYLTLEISNYDCLTNPPFYTIKFDKATFIDPVEHCDYTALKHDVPGYETGTPLPSHEWVKYCLNYKQIDRRGFLVGTHGDNISTNWQIPYKGVGVLSRVGVQFGLAGVGRLKVKVPLWKRLYLLFPHKVQRKLRYWWSEKLR